MGSQEPTFTDQLRAAALDWEGGAQGGAQGGQGLTYTEKWREAGWTPTPTHGGRIPTPTPGGRIPTPTPPQEGQGSQDKSVMD